MIVLAGLSAARADDLAPLIKSIGACKHLSVKRIVGDWAEDKVGHGFEYETSDPKTIARVLAFFESLPARDTWMRMHGTHPTPDAPSVLSIDFTKANGRTIDLFLVEPQDLFFNLNEIFELQIKDLAEFYRLIGKQDLVLLSAWEGLPVETYHYDGTADYHSRQRKVRDIQPVKREPLFDNVPFFRLREGDRLVKAREVVGIGPGKAKSGKERSDLQYYLESQGTYFQLRAEEKDGKLLLSETPDSASACMLFDWEVTLANAKAIRALLPGEWSGSFSPEKYKEIIRATRSKFPELITKETELEAYLHGDQISSLPNFPYAEFDGLIFGSRQNEICQYAIRIAPSCFFVRTFPLLKGPRRSERSKSEAAVNFAAEGISKKGSDSTAAQRKKAENEQAIEFQKMIQGIIPSSFPN